MLLAQPWQRSLKVGVGDINQCVGTRRAWRLAMRMSNLYFQNRCVSCSVVFQFCVALLYVLYTRLFCLTKGEICLLNESKLLSESLSLLNGLIHWLRLHGHLQLWAALDFWKSSSSTWMRGRRSRKTRPIKRTRSSRLKASRPMASVQYLP